MKREPWDLSETVYLRRYYNRIPFADIVAWLGRTAWTIRWKASVMGLTSRKAGDRIWESAEEARIRYGVSAEFIKRRLRRAGVPFGHRGGGYIRVRRADVDRAVADFVPTTTKGVRRACKLCGRQGHYAKKCDA